MTTLNPTDTIAEALAKHTYIEKFMRCRCGNDLWGIEGGHPAHQASVIAALPKIAIVALPEPDTTLRLRHWRVGDISVAEGTGLVWADLEPTVHHHSIARVVAANLLSAARFAHRPAAGGES